MTALRAQRITHVNTELDFSGGEVQLFLLLEGLRARGVDNVLVCRPGSRSEREARARGFETAPVRMRSYLDLAAVLGLARVFRGRRAELVHLHSGRATWLGGLAARLARVPALATRRMDRRVRRGWRTRLTFGSLVERVVAISPAIADELRGAGVPPARVVTIASAVDPGELEPALPRERTRSSEGLAEDCLLVLCLANLVPRKGIDVLLEALALLADAERVRLWVAGEGPLRAELEALAGRLGLAQRVRFLGQRADKADLLAACDVLALPSRQEGLGVAALEAMAAGVAVVASRVGGLAQAVVDGGTGLLVPPEDPRALAAALQKLCDDGALRERLAAAGPARIREGFLAEQMVAAYAALYDELLADSARQAESAASLPSR